MKETEEIIFQVKINRELSIFELVKKSLNSFEQSAFEEYLQTYLDVLKDMKKEDLTLDYFGEEENE